MSTTAHGIVQAFNAGTYKATVQLDGSLATTLAGVKVSRNIAAVDLVAGRDCAVLFFDQGNPDDAVLFAVYA